jgi:proline iminopeptidase
VPIAEVDGTSLFYEELGRGPVMLVLHGGPGFDHSYFRPDFDRLSTRTRLVYPDHRCNGRSGRPPVETFTIERAADDAAALLDHLGAHRAVVLGHSYGGFIAQEFALRHPDRLAGLVLVDTTPGQLGSTEEPGGDQGPPPPREFVELITDQPRSDAEYAAAMPRLIPFYLHRLSWADVESRMSGVVFSAEAMARGMNVLRSWSSVDRLGQVVAPTLVLVGRHDIPTSRQQSERIARRLAGPELVVFDDSGHFPWWEEPERFFAVLEGWLDRLP